MSKFMSIPIKYMRIQTFNMYLDSTMTQQAKIFESRKIFINVCCPNGQQNAHSTAVKWAMELVKGLEPSAY